MSTSFVRSSGDVFRDLGFDAEEAALLEVKSTYLHALARYVDRFPTQAAAAAALGVAPARISEIARGKLSLFSTDKLIRYASRAGIEADVKIHAGHYEASVIGRV